MLRAVVVKVTVAVTVWVPSSVNIEGETLQVVPAGAPMQLHITVWLNPFSGAADSVKVAVCPATIVWLSGDAETV